MNFISSTFCILMLGLITGSCYAFEGHATSKDGNLSVIYKVEDGYKVSVTIDTKTKKSAYQSFEKSDVSSIDVVFVDVNKDGYLDVMIQHADETGYVPVMLINRGNSNFNSALPLQLYVNTESYIIEKWPTPSGLSYQLKDMNGDGVPELIFYNAFIENKGYSYVAFELDKKKINYHLYKKGKLFMERPLE